VKPLEKQRTISPELKEAAAHLAGDWSGTFGHPEAAAETFLKGLDNRLSSYEQGQAGQGATSALGYDKKGNIEQRSMGLASEAGTTNGLRRDGARAYVARDRTQAGVKNLLQFEKKLGAKGSVSRATKSDDDEDEK
jgi:hypothetical protein